MQEAYLHWKYDDMQQPDLTAERHEIQVIDLYTLQDIATITVQATSRSVAESLTTNGYIGNTPERPSLAVSIRTLELFRRIRLRKASFSVEAFTKVVCDLYNVRSFYYVTCENRVIFIQMPYRRRYSITISNAFDAYLAILREVDDRIAIALGRDGPNWRVLNACPACSYEVRSNVFI